MKHVDQIDPGIITGTWHDEGETCHIEPDEAAPVAWIEIPAIIGIAALLIGGVLFLLSHPDWIAEILKAVH